MDSASAKMDLAVHDATSAFPDITTIQTVNLVIVRLPEVLRKHVMPTVVVLVCQTFLVNSVRNAVLVTTIIQTVWHAIAIKMARQVYLATMTANAFVRAILMVKRATSAKRASTTFPLAKNATAIRQE